MAILLRSSVYPRSLNKIKVQRLSHCLSSGFITYKQHSHLSLGRRCSSTTPPPPVVVTSPTHLTITHPSFSSAPINIPYTWLRDSCQCPECVHPSTRQKLHRTSDVPLDIGLHRTHTDAVRVEKATCAAPTTAGVQEDWVVKVAWNRPLFRHDTSSQGVTGHTLPTTDPSPPSTHVSTYPLSFLRTHSSPDLLAKFHHADTLQPKPWLQEDVNASSDLFIPYQGLQPGSNTLLQALTQLVQYGLLVIRGVPTSIPTSKDGNQNRELRKVANMFAEIRETFYGDLWDVKSLPKGESKNIAYTNLDLDLHMDLLYFASPPRYQLLHCLRNRVHGGQSLFVDALEAAHELYRTDREAFQVLAETDVGFWYINDGHHLQQRHKTFVLQGDIPTDGTTLPRVTAINYSPPFQSPLPITTPTAFYPALQKYAALLRRQEARWEYLLEEGDVAVFDNRRVLHARKSFSAQEGEVVDLKEPNRWLKGCYVEADAVMDRLRVLKAKLE